MNRLTSPIAAAVVLALFWLLLVSSSWNESATVDEPGSPAAGITHWKLNDYRLDPENGNLLHRLAALPMLGSQLPDLTLRAWLNPEPWDFGSAWLNHPDNNSVGLLRRGRAVMALVAGALAALVWYCSRSLFGPAGGMISLVLCTLSPTILANGPLMTADTLAALFFLAATWSWWRFLQRVDLPSLVISLLATSGLLVAKMSGTLIVPIALILVIVRLAVDRRQFGLIIAACVVHAVAAYVILWGCYGFRYSMMSPDQPSTRGSALLWEPLLAPSSLPELIEDLQLPGEVLGKARAVVDKYSVPLEGWTDVSDTALGELRREVLTPAQSTALDAAKAANLPPGGIIRLIKFSADHKVLPEAYLLGALHALRTTRMRWAFFEGESYHIGSPWFFPYTFAVKSPLSFLGVALLALGSVFIRSGERERTDASARSRSPLLSGLYRTVPFWTLFAVYWIAAVSSGVNIGHRHILTVYPPLFVLCGAAGVLLVRRIRWVVLGLVIANGAETAWRFPHYLAYFNGIVSPSDAYRHLVDSSLDWGQDLPGVKSYIDGHSSGGPFYLSYFGAGNPQSYGIEATLLPSFPDRVRAATWPVIYAPISSTSPTPDELESLNRKYPSYNAVGGGTDEKGKPTAVLMRRPGSWKLTGGTYLISATQLQLNPWREFEESNYQKLVQLTRPFITPASVDEFLGALSKSGVSQVSGLLMDFEQARMLRLVAFLRSYTPDANIGYSILVYRLTDADIAQALEGPPPYHVPDRGKKLHAFP